MTQPTDELPTPHPPALYDLEIATDGSDITQAAVDRAQQGAEEGLVLWARSPSMVQVRQGDWHSGPGNLTFAIVLQPDYSRQKCRELIYVANVSVIRAVAAVASVMTPVQFGWPNHLVMAGLRAGAVWVDLPQASHDSDPADPPDWAVITFAINLASYPESIENAISIGTLQGETDFTAADLFDQILRQFLSWINVWAEDGLAELNRTIAPRLSHDENSLRNRVMQLAPNTVQNDGEIAFHGLGDDGSMQLTENGRPLPPLSLEQWFDLHNTSR